MCDAIKCARCPAQSVNVFREKNRQRPKAIRESLHSLFCCAIKAKLASCLTKTTSRKIRAVVARDTAERSPQKYAREAREVSISKKCDVSQHAHEEQSK